MNPESPIKNFLKITIVTLCFSRLLYLLIGINFGIYPDFSILNIAVATILVGSISTAIRNEMRALDELRARHGHAIEPDLPDHDLGQFVFQMLNNRPAIAEPNNELIEEEAEATPLIPHPEQKLINNARESGIQIPEQFECILSGEVMAEPIYNPAIVAENAPRYERSVLNQWLHVDSQRNRGTARDPITRQPITINQYQNDLELKERISNFLENLRTQTASRRLGTG